MKVGHILYCIKCTSGITIGKSYPIFSIGNHVITIIDDFGLILGFSNGSEISEYFITIREQNLKILNES